MGPHVPGILNTFLSHPTQEIRVPAVRMANYKRGFHCDSFPQLYNSTKTHSLSSYLDSLRQMVSSMSGVGQEGTGR